MRIASTFLVSICFATACFAFDEPPVAVASSTALAAPVPVAAETTATTPVAATTAAAQQPAPPEYSDAQIKEMKSAGYKMQKRKGQTLFCKSEAQLGTRFETPVCGSYESIKQQTLNSQEFANKMQQKTASPTKGGN